MRVENSKGECNFGQHEINFAYGPRPADRGRAHDLQERGQGDRRPGGHGDHLHGQVRRARGQLVPHPPLAHAATTARRCSPTTTPLFAPFLAGQLACLQRAVPALRAEHQLLQALRRGLVRADRGRLGRRQPHVRAARRRPRRRAGGSSCACPAPTSTRTWRFAGIIAAGPARDRAAGSRSSRPSRATPTTSDKPHVPDDAARGARRRSPPARSARAAFGDEVVEHYLNNARVELEAFEAAVTDWERVRGFERL